MNLFARPRKDRFVSVASRRDQAVRHAVFGLNRSPSKVEPLEKRVLLTTVWGGINSSGSYGGADTTNITVNISNAGSTTSAASNPPDITESDWSLDVPDDGQVHDVTIDCPPSDALVAPSNGTISFVADGTESYVGEFDISPKPPDPPTPSAAATSSNQTNVIWADVAGETGYSLDRSTDPGFATVTTFNFMPNTTSYTDTGLSANTTYYYRLRTTSGGLSSPDSSTCSATTLLAAPTAISAGSAQLVTLTWAPDAGATFTVQRSTDGGSTWNTLDTTTATSDSDYDYRAEASWRVTPNTQYAYRIVASDATSPNHDSDAVSITTSNFVMLNGTVVPNEPSLAPLGFDKAIVDSNLYDEPSDDIDQAAFNADAETAARNHEPFVPDLEHWPLTLEGASKTVVENNLENLVTAITAARADVASKGLGTVEIGFYGTPGALGYGYNDGDYATWLKTCDLWTGFDSDTQTYSSQYDLVKNLDFLSPSMYAAVVVDPSGWNASQVANILTSARYMIQQDATSGRGGSDPNKPVYPFVSPEWFSTQDEFGNNLDSTFMPLDLWSLQLATIRSNPNANGLLIWLDQYTRVGDEGWYGPDEQGWWNATKTFINETPSSSAPAGPTMLTSIDGVSLSWNNPAGQVDGWVIERSTTANTWDATPCSGFSPTATTPAALPDPNRTTGSFIAYGDVTQWEDQSAKANQNYYYRVAPFNATDSLTWSSSNADMGLNWSPVFTTGPSNAAHDTDAYNSISPRSYTNSTWPGGEYCLGMQYYADGTTAFEYDNVNFSSLAPGQLSIATGAVNKGDDAVQLGVYIDSTDINNPTDGTAVLSATVEDGTELLSLSNTSGINWSEPHKVFIVFSPVSGTPPHDACAFQSFRFTPASAIYAGLSGQSFYLRKDADGQHLDVWVGQQPNAQFSDWTDQYTLSNLWQLSLSPAAQGATVTIDGSAGNPLPACGIHFNNQGNDSLQIIGTSGNDSFSEGFITSSPSRVTFDDVPVYLGNQNTITYSYMPGTGTNASTAIALYAGYTMQLQAPAGTGIRAVHFSDVVIGHSAKLTAPSTGLSDPTQSADLAEHANRLVLNIDAMSLASWPTTSPPDDLSSVGTLDLRDSDMVLGALEVVEPDGTVVTRSSPQALLDSLIQHAYNAGAWNGTGITSSTAANDPNKYTGLGYALGSLFGSGTFDGVGVSSTALVVKYTWYGDENLDGLVTSADGANLGSQGSTIPSTAWSTGDFNFDGETDDTDRDLYLAALNVRPQL